MIWQKDGNTYYYCDGTTEKVFGLVNATGRLFEAWQGTTQSLGAYRTLDAAKAAVAAAVAA